MSTEPPPGQPPSASVAGAYVGGLQIPVLLAALATWLIARRRAGGWPFWQLVLLALPFYLMIRLLAVASTASAS